MSRELFEKEFSYLNSEQKKAVEQTEGRLLILAGAGSGKTKVLTLRMAHLMLKKGVSPASILGLTFTNKAAAEMRSRLARLVDPSSASQVTLSTFHSFCMHLLRQEIEILGFTKKFSLYDEYDVQRLIHLIVRDILQQEGELPSLASTLAVIREAKNKGLKPEDLKDTTWHDAFAKEVYRRLLLSMRAYNALDFDHLLTLSVELFERFPAILAKYQERYRYLMIDEYQDTNPIQYRLASLLADKYGNLCVVGDDDQSIYGWRGADVRHILLFERALCIKLEQNYRSTNAILKAANAVIGHNAQRHVKALWSDKGEGQPIEIFHAPTESDEASAVVRRIVKWKETLKIQWKEIAILYRSNALSRAFELALMKQPWKNQEKWEIGVPYEVVGGGEFYERKEVKDLVAYLRFILNESDGEALLRIINQPRRGIGEESLDKLVAYQRSCGRSLWEVLKEVSADHSGLLDLKIGSKALKGLQEFVEVIEEAKERLDHFPLADSLQWLVARIDYQKAIREEVKSDQMRDFKAENVQEFIASLAVFEREGAPHRHKQEALASFVANLHLNQEAFLANKNKRGEDRVQLMTFHSAKGLEFPVCFLVCLEDHIIPHEKSLKETGIEEERRLMYVAITRAQRHLVLSMAKNRSRMGKESASRPSRFLFEIPKELLLVSDWRH